MTNAITHLIREARPSLSGSSCTTYSSIIRNVGKRAGVTIESAADVEKHFPALWKTITSNDNPRSRKTVLSAFVVLCNGKIKQHLVDRMRHAMMSDVQVVKDDENTLEMSETQRENWMTYDEVMKKIAELGAEVKPLFKLEKPTVKQRARIQLYIILMLLIGANIPPRRSQDLVELQFADNSKNNFLDLKKKTITYRVYKTSRAFGDQTIAINDNMIKLFKAWKKIVGDQEFVFVDTKGGKLSSQKLNQMLNSFFAPKKVGTSMLRHIFITHRLANVPKDIAEVAREMGHSVETNLAYRKIEREDDE